jgi:predicted nuclease of predicted toxin-antitoxin system
MRLLADENIPARLVTLLRNGGADVDWIKISAPGLDDAGVWSLMISQTRILLTFDKDFGELSRTKPVPIDCGVILLRIPMPAPSEIDSLAKIILERSDWTGRFTVIEPGRVRSKPLAAKT